MARPWRPCALLALLLALPAAAAAQQPADTTRGDTLRRPVPLAPLVVTAAKTPIRADQVGFALAVVDSARLAREPARFAADALRTLPGSHIDEAVGPGGPAIVRLRGGEEVFTQILVDGVKVNANGGFFDFQGVTLGNVDRIEVARGPQSALYGSSAMSGVVHFITRAGQPGPPRFAGSWEGGHATEHGGAYRGTAAVSGGSAGVRYSAGLGTTYDRGVYDLPHDIRSHEGSLRLDAAPARGWEVGANARLISVDARLPVRDPGATRAPLDPNARSERDRLVASAQARYAAGPRWTHQLRASAYREYFVYDDRRDDVPANPEFFVFDATFRLESELWRLGAEYTGSYEHRTGPGAAPFALTYGAQWEREALTDETSGDFGDNTQSLDRPSGSVFAEARATLPGRVYLLAGARAERYEGLPTEVTPRVSAVYEAVPGALSLRAAAGMAYKAPNLQEQYLDNPFIAGNPDLEPERSTSWEVGADVRALDDRATLGLTWFHQRFEDLIRTVQLEGDTRQINRNLGSSLAQGVEWTARWEGSDRWAVGTEGAWIATEVRDNRGLSPDQFPEGEALPGRPEVVGSAYLEVAAGPRLRAILRGTHVGSQVQLSERFSGQRVELDAYTLAGVTVHYLVSPRWSVYGRLQNLFDTEYEAAFDRPGAPLSAALGVRLN